MRQVLRVTITAAFGMALLSCTAPPRQVNGAAFSFRIAGFDDVEAILDSVLAPSKAYVLPPLSSVVPRQTRKSYSANLNSRPKTPSPMLAHGPRPGPTLSKTVRTEVLAGAVEQKSEAKFKAAQAKAQRDGVETLTQKDIEGLSLEQIKQLRGY
jgi:hypothetical protein